MSRHVIPNAPGSPVGRVTTVGWDAPLNTFFGMAFDKVPDTAGDDYQDEVEVFWVGMMPGEIPTVEALAKVLGEHGVALPVWAAGALAEDRRVEGDRSKGRPVSGLFAALFSQEETWGDAR